MATTWLVYGQLFYDGAWNVLPELIDSNAAVQLERGVDPAELDIKPATCTFRLNDPTDLYRPSNAASALYGQTGPYMRGAYATGGSVRFTGEAQAMEPGETGDHQAVGGVTVKGNRWVDVKLGGPLARVGRWRDPLASPLFTQITGGYTTNLRGYFPLEDGRDSTQLANYARLGPPATFYGGVRLAAADGPDGSGQVLEMTAAGGVDFRYTGMSASAGYQLAFAVELINTDATLRDVFSWVTSNGYTWTWRASDTAYSLRIVDGDGAVLKDETYSPGSDAAPGVGQWVYTRIKVSQSGGTVTVEPSWYAELAENFWGVTTTFSGTAGAPQRGRLRGNVATDGAHYGHHFVVTTTADNLESSDFTDAFAGYRRERAAERFARLCSSRNLSYVLRGTSSLTAEMGPQPLATFLDQLKEIRQSEGGLIFDRGDNIGIVFATRDYLYDQAAAPVLELTWPDDISPPLKEITGAADTYNLVTAKNRTGSSVTAELTSGRYGTENPPTGAGRLEKTIDVNHATDERLTDVANWWMRFYTQPVPRFDTIVIDADAHPELLTACNSAEPGMFIRLTGRTPDPLLLLIVSTAQNSHRTRNVFTFKVVAGDIFRVAVEDDASSLIDSSSTTLAEDLDTTETGVNVRTVELGDVWSTAGGYDVAVAGERMSVSSVTAAVLSGGYWTQTMTVVRSVNGVVKSHTTGAEVHIADPVHVG